LNWYLILGSLDPKAEEELPSGSLLDRAIWSYNNAVDTLNEYCENEIVTNPTAQAVRSIGAGFEQADTSSKYSVTSLETHPLRQSNYNGVGKIGDMNAEQDVVRMSYFSSGSDYNTFGYANTYRWYWVASRYLQDYSDYVNFMMRRVTDHRLFKNRISFVDIQHLCWLLRQSTDQMSAQLHVF